METEPKPNGPEDKEKLSLKVIIADDEKMLRGMLKTMLEGMGHTVKMVGDGKQLFDELNGSENFDLIISDNSMPEKRGIEVLTEIRGIEKLQRVPFILSTTDTGDLEQRVNELGGLYLSKPYGFRELEQAIDTVMKDRKS